MGKMRELERTRMAFTTTILAILLSTTNTANAADESNPVFDPCSDATVAKSDGFSFGLAFAANASFFAGEVQFSPCDRRLALASKHAQLAVFRPQVDQLSLLTINSTTFDPAKAGGFMVAFAGRNFAARSVPTLVADGTMSITSFTLVLEFQTGTLVNLYWKKFGCGSCSGEFRCLNEQDCAIPTKKCRSHGGSVDCEVNIQLAFSGTDKYLETLNSWYEVSSLGQYSLYGLYSNVKENLFM
ncbi:unnamed protein product [Linum tenue]|uniref:Expp1 protein n=1 Tax=Linum tenue TaxID=586396 RepID=A0AAV0JD31_9ROSI|nr:unnamed protein product [Linum tenue]